MAMTNSTSDGGLDDLTTLTGIGPARQRWLRESLNVRTFEDLAALSVEGLGTRAKTERQVTSRVEIERILAQARELAGARNSAPRNGRKGGDGGKVESTRSPGAPGDWRVVASFVVEFQAGKGAEGTQEHVTKVHHVEGDKTATWNGIEAEPACQWMLGRLRELGELAAQEGPPSPPQKGSAVAAMAGTSFGAVEVDKIRVSQPPQAEPLGEIERGDEGLPISVWRAKPLGLTASFRLTGPGAADAAQRKARYTARFYAQDRATAETLELGDPIRGTVQAEGVEHEARLEVPTPPAGMYRLKVVALVEGARLRPGYIEVPWLQVV